MTSVADGYGDLFGGGVVCVNGVNYHGTSGLQFVKTIAGHKKKYAFYVMADAQAKDPNGTSMQAAKAYIEKENLGPMIETEDWWYNECHGPRYIKIYVWRPDWEGADFKKWVKKNDPKPVDMKSSDW